jgi:hypothetical protein
MKNSLAVIVGAATLALVVAPSKASAQVNIYVSPGGYAHYGYAYPHYGYGYAYPHYGYGYAYPHYGYPGYGYYGGYWGHGRRVARRVWRRRERWGW